MRLVYNQRNTGSPFLQWKRAAALARGQLLWIAESDDVASPLLLETLVRALMLNPLAGLAYCQSLRMDRNGDLGESFTHWTDDLDPLRWRQDYTNRGRDEICRFMIRRNIVPNASAVVVRKDLLIAAVEGAEKFRFAGDWLTWAKVLCQTDIIFVSAALNFFRTHQDSVRDTIKLTQACAKRLAVVNAICRAMAVPRAARCQA